MPNEAGCGVSDSGVVDAGGNNDAGDLDAGVDAGVMDAGAMDAGVMDAGAMDAGAMDAGVMDAGTPDAGADAGIDAGSWNVVWRSVYEIEAHHLVGYGNEAALVGFSPGLGALILRALEDDGPAVSQVVTMQTDRPTSAYLRDGRLVVGVENRDLFLWSKVTDSFTHLATRARSNWTWVAGVQQR